jgi:hypothetical protein
VAMSPRLSPGTLRSMREQIEIYRDLDIFTANGPLPAPAATPAPAPGAPRSAARQNSFLRSLRRLIHIFIS